MKATAKYLFDEDFATGEKPTITLVEAERRRADAESQAYRKGFAAGQRRRRPSPRSDIATALGDRRRPGAAASRRSPASRRGWKPKRSKWRSRSPASSRPS